MKTILKSKVILVVLVCLFSRSGYGAPIRLVLRPTDDTYIYSEAFTTNYGTETNIKVGRGSFEYRTYLRFDLSRIPDGKTIAISSDNGINLLESKVPVDGYELRRNGKAALKLVDELYEKHDLYSEVINKLKADETLDKSVRKIALQIANARQWEDAEKLKKQSSESADLEEDTAEQKD